MNKKKGVRAKANQAKPKTVALRLHRDLASARYSLPEAGSKLQSLLSAGRDADAIYLLEQMCKQFRKEKLLFINLLQLYLGHTQLDKAEALTRVMLKQFSSDSDVLIRVAMFHQRLGDVERTIELVQKALLLNPNNTEGQRLLGTTYQGLGDKDSALECFYKVLASEPQNTFALLSIAIIEKSNATPAFRESVLDLVNSEQPARDERVLLHFALAWLFESIDVDVHFDHLRKANAIASETRPWNYKAEALRYDSNVALFGESQVEALASQGDTDFQPIFIAAMPRSGSTLLEQMLGAHSDACGVGENAPFTAAIDQALLKDNPVAQRFRQTKGRPLDCIGNYREAILEIARDFRAGGVVANASGKRIVDKSMGNSFVVGPILLAFPNARIVHLQRHPLDIIYSCYKQYFGVGYNFIFDLKSAAQHYKIYTATMAHWKSLFPDRITTVRYEDLIDNPKGTLRSLLEFCRLPWEDSCVNYRDTMGLIHTASADQVSLPLYRDSLAKWKKVENYLKAASDELGDYLAY